MGRMLDKKERKLSAQAVEKFLNQMTGTDKFDVIVRYLDDNNIQQIDVFRNISISFVEEQYPHEETSYSISIHTGDDVANHSISFADLPQQHKSYFDRMSCSNRQLTFHSSWHRSIWFYVYEYDSSPEHEEMIQNEIREFSRD